MSDRRRRLWVRFARHDLPPSRPVCLRKRKDLRSLCGSTVPCGRATATVNEGTEAVIRTNTLLIARSIEPERFSRLYYSNTSSAHESKDVGIVSPSAFLDEVRRSPSSRDK